MKVKGFVVSSFILSAAWRVLTLGVFLPADSSVRLTQFVYQKLGTTEFCLPEGFTLDQHATVHIIIPG